MEILKPWKGEETVGATLRKTNFKCVFKGKIIKINLQICCTRRAKIYIEVSYSNKEMSFI
jgi:hypothetical protein